MCVKGGNTEDSSLAWELGMAGRGNLYEPEAESKSWVGEKRPVKMGDILNAVSEIYQNSAREMIGAKAEA